jgi:hypothetical protein
MSQNTRTIWAGFVVTGLAAIALVPAFLHGNDARRAAPPDKLVVHEWGTFTSFAGSDGLNLEFRPLVTNDLPRFIETPHSIWLKDRVIAQQRMETPVTYFYTDVPRTVNVRVDFPRGLLTEWYPKAKRSASGDQNIFGTIQGRAFLDWGPVRLTPPEQFADVRVRVWQGKKSKVVPASLPPVAADDHYGQARETDSAIVETVDANRFSQFEKFLFYRGLGNFELPIKLVALGGDRFEITNSAKDASGALLLVRIDKGRVRFTRIDPVSPGSAIEIALPSAESTVDGLAAAMVRELNAAGLYEKESLAMVNTWRTSWFGENGTRLLYLVPGKLTDELLPLTVEPAPDECVRVLVGRLETLSPEDCQRLVHTLAGSADEEPTAEAIKTELASLGRFAEPSIQFMIGQTKDPQVRSRLEAIHSGIRDQKSTGPGKSGDPVDVQDKSGE